MTSKKVIVKGIVQGVFFRKYTKEKAIGFGLKGFVRNEPDGTVYLEIEGDESAVKSMIKWCNEGSPDAVVNEVIANSQSVKVFKEFEIRY